MFNDLLLVKRAPRINKVFVVVVCLKLYILFKTMCIHIQLFRERLSEKNVHATIPKGNMGYDQYTVPDTVAVELGFVAFL